MLIRYSPSIFVLFQFLPLSVFVTYAYWHGSPGPERWVEAFKVGAALALVQFVLALLGTTPVNRLILGANLYLLVGGAAGVAKQWDVLTLYGRFMESGVFVYMTLVGLVTTVWSPVGYVGVPHPDTRKVRRYSLYLLAVTAGALGMSVLF